MKLLHPTSRTATASPRTERGSVLIIVLWVAFGLVSLAIYFANSSSLELRAADNRVATLEAEQAIVGAARYVSNALANVTEPGTPPDPATFKVEAIRVGNARYWLIGQPLDEEDDDAPTWGLVDESSKLNLNTATAAMLQKLPRMTAALAAAVVDWRDADSELSENGAEDETYARLNPPYRCKNAPFETIEELRLVAGFTYDILYDEDANMNAVLDDNENDEDATMPNDNHDGILNRGVLAYVTVHSQQPNTRTNGDPKVNLNPVDEPALRRLMSDAGISADKIVRTLAIFGGGGPPGPGNTNAPPQPGANTNGSVLQFYVRSGLSAEDFALIENDISITTNSVVEGLVNVNTATATVLACLPGMDESKAAALVAARAGQTGVHSIAWVKDALDAQSATQLGPWITGRSYQYSADIAAVGHHGRGYSRAKFYFDNTSGTPRIAQRQELTALGWALGRGVREQLADLQREP
ncbi:MAG: general secretion pathway protein GspK [Limisphaerales bacterium]